jgi:hypothetical protein
MYKFWAKMNRGIVLGMIMLMGLAVYFIVDARAFEGEADEIKNMLFEFAHALEEINREFTPEANCDFINRFYTEYREASWHPSIPSMKQSAENTLETFLTLAPEQQSRNTSFNLTEIFSINKLATHVMRVNFMINVTPGNHGSNEGILFFDGFNQAYFRWGAERIHANAILIRTRGEWRFASVHFWMF